MAIMDAPKSLPDQDEFIDKLRTVGLGRYEAAVYLGLITDSTARVSEISKRTGVPQPKVYQALDSLVEKGFCALGPDGVNRYRPIDPQLAMGGHLSALRRSEQSALALVGELSEVRERGQGRQLWAPPIEITKGRRQVTATVTQEVARATTLLQFVTRPPLVMREELIEAVHDAIARGVEVQVVYEAGLAETEDVEDEMAALRGAGAEVRVGGNLPAKLLLVDGHIALSAVATTRGDNIMIMTLRDPGLVAHFQSSFAHVWDSAGDD